MISLKALNNAQIIQRFSGRDGQQTEKQIFKTFEEINLASELKFLSISIHANLIIKMFNPQHVQLAHLIFDEYPTANALVHVIHRLLDQSTQILLALQPLNITSLSA